MNKKEKKIVCDRCGNPNHLFSSMYFPYSKTRINLCDICYLGIASGLKLDFEKVLRVGLKNLFKEE